MVFLESLAQKWLSKEHSQVQDRDKINEFIFKKAKMQKMLKTLKTQKRKNVFWTLL